MNTNTHPLTQLLRLGAIAALLASSAQPARALGPGMTQPTFTAAEIGHEIFNFPNATVGEQPTIVEFQRGYLYIGAGSDSPTTRTIGSWWNFSNPRTPVLIQAIPFSGGNKPHMAAFWDDKFLDGTQLTGFRWWNFETRTQITKYNGAVGPVWYMGQVPYVYLPRNGYGSGTNQMEIAKINGTSVTRLNLFDLGASIGFPVGSLHAIGNLLVASASQTQGVATFDISDPAHPVLLSRVVTGGSVYTSMVHGSRVYQCEQGSGIRVYDFSNPSNIQQVGFLDLPANPRYVNFKETQGFCVPGSNQMFVFDATTLAVQNTYTLSGASDFVYPLGNMAITGGNGSQDRCSIIPIAQQPDTQGPAMQFVSPAVNAVSQNVLSRVGFIMSDQIDVTSLTQTSFIVRPLGGSAIAGTYSTQMGMINFSPSAPLLNNTTYEVILPAGGIRDVVGNGLRTAFSMRFSTGPTINGTAAGNDGTIAHWRLNNAGDDSSNNGHTLILNGGATFSTDRQEGSNSLLLDGTTGYADAGSISVGDTFTIAGWIKLAAGRTNIQTIAANSPGGIASSGFRFYVNTYQTANQNLVFETGNGTTGVAASSANNVIVPGSWVHAAVVVNRTAGTARFFVNGVDRSTTTAARTDFNTSAGVNLGRMLTGGFLFGGNMDDMRIYPRELSANELKDIMILGLAGQWLFNGTGEDSSGNGHTATLNTGATFTTQSAEGPFALGLDGATGFAGVGTFNLGTAFTIAMRLHIPGAATNIQTLAANTPGGSAQNGFRFFVDTYQTNDRRLILETGNGTTGASIRSGANLITSDQWSHVAVTIDRTAGTAKLYYRGVDTGATGAIRTDFANNAVLQFGAMLNAGSPLRDALDDVRVYNRVLSATEIATIAAGANLPPTISFSGLTAGVSTTVGAAAQFTITATDPDPNNTLTYAFDFGDGTTTNFSASSTASHTYSAPGRYTVIARVTDGIATVSNTSTVIVTFPPTATPAVASSPIIYDATRNKVWCVNPDSNTVSRADAVTLAKEAEIPVGARPRSLALKPGGASIWVVCGESSEVDMIDPVAGTVTAVAPLNYGLDPAGIVFAPNGGAAFVAAQGGEALLKLNATSGAVTTSLDLGNGPNSVAISGDSARLLVTRFISPDSQGEIWDVNASAMTLTRTMPLPFDNTPDAENRGRGVPNYLMQVGVTPDGRTAWIPAKKDNIARGLFRDGLPLTHDNTVRSIICQLDLTSNTENLASRLDIDNHSLLGTVCFSPRGDIAFAAFLGNNEIIAFDAVTRANLSTVTTGHAPLGLCVKPDGTKLYALNFTDRTLSSYDISQLVNGVSSVITPLANTSVVATELLTAQALHGKQIFYNAADTRMAAEGYIMCASCHLEGDHDGRTWDFTDRGEGLRNTIDLRGHAGMLQGRVHWSGNFDEIQDFEGDIRNAFGGTGFMSDTDFNTGTRNTPLGDPKAGLSADLDALAAYVATFTEPPSSPYRPAGAHSAAALNGRQHFLDLQCFTCHRGSEFTDSAAGVLHDVGTIKPSSGHRLNGPLTGIDTPTLKGLWVSAPYLHDGSAPDLLSVFNTTNAPSGTPHAAVQTLTSAQQTELITYLLELDGSDAVAETETLTVADSSGDTHRIIADPQFSGGSGTILDATAVGDYVTYLVQGVAAGSYDVRIGIKAFTSRGIVQLAIGRADNFVGTASNVGAPQDQYSATSLYEEIDLGTWSPGSSSDKWFQFKITGKNPSSTGFSESFDYIKLIPK